MWMTFNHLEADSTKFTHYRLKIRKVIEFSLIAVLDATSPLCPKPTRLFIHISEVTKHYATDDGNVDLDLSRKFYIQSLENKYKVVDLLVRKLLNDITLD